MIGLLAAAGALRFVLRAGKIDSEHVFAALSAYLLAGLFFGLIYWALELAMPGSFGWSFRLHPRKCRAISASSRWRRSAMAISFPRPT